MKKPKTKTLNKTAMLKNIRGLSLCDKAYCGPYGIVTCRSLAVYKCGEFISKTNSSGNFRGMQHGYKRNSRLFSVSGSTKIHNRGNYTMASLRKAICG